MQTRKLNPLIAIILGITVLSFSLTVLVDDAYSLRNADRDYDGILDEDDQCPQIAETFNKFEDEDGCPDTVIEEKTKYEFPDTDGDGFEDRVDNCVNLPETFNGYLDDDGCPERFAKTADMEKDSDGDSVPDSIDACPTEKETINEFKDGDGCPDSLGSSSSTISEFGDGQCRGEKIAVMRVHTNDIVCVDLNTAERWEGYGLGEIIVKSEPANGNLVVSGAEMMKGLAERQEAMKEDSDKIIPQEHVDEKSILPVVSGGTKPITATPIIGNPTISYPENYIPGNEELTEDEIRLTFLGTGMPYPTRNQAAAGVLMEFGNGEILMFDVGSGTVANFNSMKIPPADLTKFFITHLHTDHQGDFDMFWAQGMPFGRILPMQVWGPTGDGHALGVQSFVDGILDANY